MQSFSEQCLDMARSILGENLASINADGTVTPFEHEQPRLDEAGHAALAIGEFYRATGETSLGDYDLVDLSARCITSQAFCEPAQENGLAYAALGLLSWGPAKERNQVWERLVDPTRERLDTLLLARSDYQNHWQAFNIAKAVTRYSMGLSKKDETGKLIDRFLERIDQKSTGKFVDDYPENLGGGFNIYGVLAFVFIRQALQLHANINLKERKLPSLRTHGERYIKMFPDLIRHDGLGWSYGRGIGAYGQMHCISLILQGLRDGWVPDDQKNKYFDLFRRLFHFFFVNYLDQESGCLVIRDGERNTIEEHTTRMANFDAARYLSQWSRLARSITTPATAAAKAITSKPSGRFIAFDKSNRKEQGLFLYRDPDSGFHAQLPLVSGGGAATSDSLAFPHCPGVFDWPAADYLPVMLPELTIDGTQFIPAYYGKRIVTGLGLRNSFYFRYEQPELISKDEVIHPGIGSCKVNWNFEKGKITSEFSFTVKGNVQLSRMRYMLVIASPHSRHRIGNTLTLGQEGFRCSVVKDDFHANWQETEVVSDNPAYKTYYGKIHYLQTLLRDHPLIMRPGQTYRLTVTFEPDIATIES